MIWVFCPCQWWFSQKKLDRGGWLEFYPFFFKFYILAKPAYTTFFRSYHNLSQSRLPQVNAGVTCLILLSKVSHFWLSARSSWQTIYFAWCILSASIVWPYFSAITFHVCLSPDNVSMCDYLLLGRWTPCKHKGGILLRDHFTRFLWWQHPRGRCGRHWCRTVVAPGVELLGSVSHQRSQENCCIHNFVYRYPAYLR